MSKRAPQFERNERDLYLTPEAAVLPLKPFLKPGTRFYEPCAADGGLARALIHRLGLECMGMSDIHPLNSLVDEENLLDIDYVRGADCIITNPPWKRDLLHPIIDHLKWVAPTWLLIDADWLFTKQAAEHLPSATDIVAIGRVKWIPGSDSVGKDNCCWVRFKGGHDEGARFHANW
jgi:hypothetical protein